MFIEVKNIAKSYTNTSGVVQRKVLTNLNLTAEKGEKIAIMGPSGSGKTTLLNLLATFDLPDTGEIVVNNRSYSAMTQNDLLAYRNKEVGFVFQFHHLLPQCTLLENVLLPTIAHKESKNISHGRAEQLLKHMGLWEYRNNKPDELSGGECQRAAVARALINEPQLLLADEPTGSLDSANAQTLLGLLLSVNAQRNINLIIATHSPDIASKMDKIYTISNGQLNLTKA
jgi:ABC-type lipoprotein export system ATPase subunit